MPTPSPFHERTAPLCRSYAWKDWAGYCAVCSYDTSHEREYFAFRETAGLLDVSPLFKYEVTGPDAKALLARMMTRDIASLKVGRVAYSCWCDDAGRVVDDGTVARLDEEHYRVTAADPSLHLTDQFQKWVIPGDTVKAIAERPNAALFHDTLGNILKAQNKVEEAIACFEKALELKPDFIDSLNGSIYGRVKTNGIISSI